MQIGGASCADPEHLEIAALDAESSEEPLWSS